MCLWGCIPTSICWICWETTKSTPNDTSSMEPGHQNPCQTSQLEPDSTLLCSSLQWYFSNTLSTSDLEMHKWILFCLLSTSRRGDMVPGVRPSPMRWVGSDTAERSWGSQSQCGRWRGQGSVQECLTVAVWQEAELWGPVLKLGLLFIHDNRLFSLRVCVYLE